MNTARFSATVRRMESVRKHGGVVPTSSSGSVCFRSKRVVFIFSRCVCNGCGFHLFPQRLSFVAAVHVHHFVFPGYSLPSLPCFDDSVAPLSFAVALEKCRLQYATCGRLCGQNSGLFARPLRKGDPTLLQRKRPSLCLARCFVSRAVSVIPDPQSYRLLKSR